MIVFRSICITILEIDVRLAKCRIYYSDKITIIIVVGKCAPKVSSWATMMVFWDFRSILFIISKCNDGWCWCKRFAIDAVHY